MNQQQFNFQDGRTEGEDLEASLVRPDRQFTYDGLGMPDWPSAKPLNNRNCITVDRVTSPGGGPEHRFVIKRGDPVRVWLGASGFYTGRVTGISHKRREVCVSSQLGHKGTWHAVATIYPAPAEEPAVSTDDSVARREVTEGTNIANHPRDEFAEADVVLPATERYYLTVYIDLAANALPEISAESLHNLRWAIRDAIEDRSVAEVIGSGNSADQMDIGMEVTNVERAQHQVRAIAAEFGFPEVEFVQG
ncbi:MAG: hypothetical protein AAGB04_08530 [Pseudomonadota bacterium]